MGSNRNYPLVNSAIEVKGKVIEKMLRIKSGYQKSLISFIFLIKVT